MGPHSEGSRRMAAQPRPRRQPLHARPLRPAQRGYRRRCHPAHRHAAIDRSPRTGTLLHRESGVRGPHCGDRTARPAAHAGGAGHPHQRHRNQRERVRNHRQRPVHHRLEPGLGAAVQPGAVGGRGCELSLSARLVGLFRRAGGAGRGAHHALCALHPRPRIFVRYAGFGGLVRQPDCSGVLSACGAPQLAHRTGCPHPLPAGHAVRDARNAHAALRHPGIERADLPLFAHGGETQAGGRGHPFGIEAAGAHG